jgi:predicted short-subunit dehydrogenase-like oxidoreductase (DUF2520 family)
MKIVLLGSGNLAWHLSGAFYEMKNEIIQIYSRNIENATSLAVKYGATAISNAELLSNNADLYIIAVSDNAIEQILKKTDFINKNVVHTAGSVSISVFNGKATNFGVFYPLQTFSKDRAIEFNNIPICIEASNEVFNKFLIELARQISNNVWQINSENRKILHLSAVFACNYVNHLYTIAEKILNEKEIPFSILHELIKETAYKALEMDPINAQTGPARRNDIEVLKKHLDLLSSRPELKKIYELLGRDIYLNYS